MTRKTVLLMSLVLVSYLLFGVDVLSQSRPTGNKVDLNTASVSELDGLPGIGPAIAERIVEFRTKNGAFRKPEDLMSVKGIGEKKFFKLKDRITVSGGQSPARPARDMTKKPPATKPRGVTR